MSDRVPTRVCLVITVVALWAVVASRAMAGEAAAPTGLWRGTSTCTDRVAAPACKDEVVIYEFHTDSAGAVQWQADKVVDGQRLPMGELALHFDTVEGCWTAQFDSPRTQVVWRLRIDGERMTGSATLRPGNQVVRRIDVHKESAHE